MTLLFSDDFNRDDGPLGDDWATVYQTQTESTWPRVLNDQFRCSNAMVRCEAVGSVTDIAISARGASPYNRHAFGIVDEDNFFWYLYNTSGGVNYSRIQRTAGGTVVATYDKAFPSGKSTDYPLVSISGGVATVTIPSDPTWSHEVSLGGYTGGYVGLANTGASYNDDFAVYSVPPRVGDTGDASRSVPPCTAYITPPGRAKIPLALLDEPEYAEAAAGGYTVATLLVRVDRDRDRIADAAIEIHPPKGEVWMGRVASVEWSGALATLNCVGRQHDYSRQVREALYCDTSVADWQERKTIARNRDVGVSTDVDRLVYTFKEGTQYPAEAFNGHRRWIPGTTTVHVKGNYERPNNAYRLRIRAAIYAAGQGLGENLSEYTDVQWELAAGSGANSGSFAFTIPQAGGIMALTTAVTHVAGATITGGDATTVFSNLRVYGVSGVVQSDAITGLTAPQVINHICDQQPAWVLPSGSQYRAWIGTDTTLVEPYTADMGMTDLSIIEGICSFRDYDFSIRSRLVDGTLAAVPVYEPRSTTPVCQYTLTEGDNLLTDDITQMCNRVRVLYSFVDGRPRWTEVTSAHDYLSETGQGRTEVIRADTTSLTQAQAIGTRYLATRNRPASGSLTITGGLRDMLGAEMLPCQLVAGKWMRLHNTPIGSVDARITEVTKQGASVATVTLDTVPTALDTELAMLTKRR